MLIFSGRPLRSILAEYEAHYNGWRPHRQIRPPRPDESVADLSQEPATTSWSPGSKPPDTSPAGPSRPSATAAK